MGSDFEIIMCGGDASRLADAAEEALDVVQRLEMQMSVFIPTSEISWMNFRAASEPVIVEPRLFVLLQLAARVSEHTNGAFDITAGPLVRCWGFRDGEPRVPSGEEIACCLRRVGMGRVLLNQERRTVQFQCEGMQLDLGGIGKGCAVQRAAQLLMERGVKSALIHAGFSTVYAIGSPPGEEGWPVGLLHPLDGSLRIAVISLRDRALSTSSVGEQFFEAGGRRYSHVLDPRTGYPCTGLLSATVVSASAEEADALSTAFLVMGLEESNRYVRERQGIEAILIPAPDSGSPRAIPAALLSVSSRATSHAPVKGAAAMLTRPAAHNVAAGPCASRAGVPASPRDFTPALRERL
jgi:thiamine biosynthesis lipoprotein